MADNNLAARPQNAFEDEVALTYAPFKAYVTHVVPLILEHIWVSRMHKQSDYSVELMNNGWLGRLVTLDRRVLDPLRQDEIVEWPSIRNYLISTLGTCQRNEHVSGVIAKCMGVLLPVLERRFRKNYCFEKKPYHCWWVYDS